MFLFFEKESAMEMLAIVGSNNSNSITLECVRIMLETIKQKKEEVKFDIIKLENLRVAMCKGCQNCMKCGKCIFDGSDQMEYVKERMIAADIILLASPVYINNVSGIMKNFIDRLSNWIHIFRLTGKKAIIITTSYRSGNQYVSNYLQHVSWHLGLGVIGKYDLITSDSSITENTIKNYAIDIIKTINSGSCQYGPFMNKKFESTKLEVQKAIEIGKSSFEIEYWTKYLLTFENWQELLSYKKINSNLH